MIRYNKWKQRAENWQVLHTAEVAKNRRLTADLEELCTTHSEVCKELWAFKQELTDAGKAESKLHLENISLRRQLEEFDAICAELSSKKAYLENELKNVQQESATFSRLLKIVKATVNAVDLQGEDTLPPFNRDGGVNG